MNSAEDSDEISMSRAAARPMRQSAVIPMAGFPTATHGGTSMTPARTKAGGLFQEPHRKELRLRARS